MTAHPSEAATIADRLRAARRARFVGRRGELELFRAALDSDSPPFAVLYLYGPGGIGKSALLDQFQEISLSYRRRVIALDARNLDPSPAAFLDALGGELPSEPAVLLLDTYEVLAPLDVWLRGEFLPSLPSDVTVVIAGRNPPSPEWLADPGWQDLLRVVSLRNLAPEDTRTFLAAAGVAAARHDVALQLTHGHPLSLALMTEVLRAEHLADSDLALAPNIVAALLHRFVDAVPSLLHRSAVEVCSLAQYTTEALLRDVLPGDDVPDLFTWLRAVSFVEEGPWGVFPHDAARDALDADLRWRDENRYVELHDKVREHVLRTIAATTGRTQLRHVHALAYLHRRNRAVSGFWDWATFGQAYTDELSPSDHAAIIAMTEQHQGPEQADYVRFWLEHQPSAFIVFRAGEPGPIGFACRLELHGMDPAERDADPGTRAMWRYVVQTAPPLPGETVYAARFLIDAIHNQEPSMSQNLISVRHTQELLRATSPAWDLIGAYADGERWAPLFDYLDFHRATAAEYDVGGAHYSVFAHDWRRKNISDWLDMMGRREVGEDITPPTAPVPEVALSQPDFEHAVRDALKHFRDPARLARNPLATSRLTRGAAHPVAELQRQITAAAESLGEDPRSEKLYRVINRTYLHPAVTQEKAAEVLGLPFSTYRRHLTRGVERIAADLWHRELYG
ncbi:P-loop NTPase family protein [Hoyosella subflava]|uniref:AAA ATPase n=1 Tax=Hoyosella subflava (strain DSM 45089 / JCM 17490 / NBRC 109087 / DQS3-9A1) TaxID=443218 RepID=F6EJW3_HOYSD|nr:AAA family ATPase [Hoyosella subflava]AEF41321.1 AAA ATPase [Hoyosella subflava DQS3-9A1]